MLTKAAQEFFRELDQKGEPFAPRLFVQTLKLAHPSFGQTDERGHPMQQDAEEFFSVMLQKLRPHLMMDANDGTETKMSLVDRLFNIDTLVTYKNTEVPEEPA